MSKLGTSIINKQSYDLRQKGTWKRGISYCSSLESLGFILIS